MSAYREVAARVARSAGVLLLLTGVCLSGAARAADAPPAHATFTSTSQAVHALYSAVKSGDRERLAAIFGPGTDDLIDSGDPIADKAERESFLKAYRIKHKLVAEGDDRRMLSVGAGDWVLPTPLVRRDGAWSWDGAAGADELIYRRIGINELGAIDVCAGVVAAQTDYYAANPEHAKVPTYATKLLSDPGHHNGLYWATGAGEAPSPAGELLAAAAAEGANASTPTPYHGYYYRLLKAQGAAAPGGAKSYEVDGALSGGFALVAWPAQYRASGVMTFIVNQDGIVYQKDLGDDTDTLARAMQAFDPDSSWKRADSP